MNPVLSAHAHGGFGAWSWVEWAIFAVCCLVTAWVFWVAIRLTLHPGEEERDHVKRSILDDDAAPPRPRPPGPLSSAPR